MDILSGLIGFVLCVCIFCVINRFRFSGYLRIDNSDPSKDYYLIDISKDLDKVSERKSIILKIDTKYRKTQ